MNVAIESPLRGFSVLDSSLQVTNIFPAQRGGVGYDALRDVVYAIDHDTDELVAWSGGPLRVSGRCSSGRGDSRLRVVIDSGTRTLLLNDVGKEMESYLGQIDVVDLTGERMNVLRGGPSERRRFIDRGIVGLRPSHLRVIGEYRRVLRQRNALLRREAFSAGGDRSLELDSWDERLRGAARTMHLARRQYTETLGARLEQIGGFIVPEGKKLGLSYQPSPTDAGETPEDRLDELLGASLERGRKRDLALGHTAEGPHRDELRVTLEGVDLRRFGSAGQVRAAMIALKLAKLSLLRNERGESPLFLMDDFDSDLDETRIAALADFLHQGGFQTLVATSKEAQIGRIEVSFMKLRMEDGVARAA
jgi:DNA replication and repair protein RecF